MIPIKINSYWIGAHPWQGYFIKPVAGGGESRATESDFNSTHAGVPYQNIQHNKIALDNSFQIGKNRLTINVGYQKNKRKEFGNIDLPQETSLYFDLSTLTYTAQFHWKEINGWASSVGVNGMRQNNINKGIEIIKGFDSTTAMAGCLEIMKAHQCKIN